MNINVEKHYNDLINIVSKALNIHDIKYTFDLDIGLLSSKILKTFHTEPTNKDIIESLNKFPLSILSTFNNSKATLKSVYNTSNHKDKLINTFSYIINYILIKNKIDTLLLKMNILSNNHDNMSLHIQELLTDFKKYKNPEHVASMIDFMFTNNNFKNIINILDLSPFYALLCENDINTIKEEILSCNIDDVIISLFDSIMEISIEDYNIINNNTSFKLQILHKYLYDVMDTSLYLKKIFDIIYNGSNRIRFKCSCIGTKHINKQHTKYIYTKTQLISHLLHIICIIINKADISKNNILTNDIVSNLKNNEDVIKLLSAFNLGVDEFSFENIFNKILDNKSVINSLLTTNITMLPDTISDIYKTLLKYLKWDDIIKKKAKYINICKILDGYLILIKSRYKR